MKKRKFAAGFLFFFAACASAAPKAGDFITQGPAGGKQIAITFDDGPGPHTEKFLDLLDRYQVKATFYMLGERTRLRPAVVKKIAERGHEPASHTMTHMNYNKRYKARLNETGDPDKAAALAKRDLVEDMRQSRALIEKNAGRTLTTLRMPYGIDRPWIKAAALEAGFVLVNWTHGADWASEPAEKLIPGYVKAVKPGAIILLHDGWPESDKSLAIAEAVINAAKEKGLEVVTVEKLLKLR